MSRYNFHLKKFALVDNSVNGKVNAETIFEYEQEGDLVTANYRGGGIRYGKIIARLENESLHMLYQCLTETDELKAGKAIAAISVTSENKLCLNLDWEWLGDESSKGTSEYVEIG